MREKTYDLNQKDAQRVFMCLEWASETGRLADFPGLKTLERKLRLWRDMAIEITNPERTAARRLVKARGRNLQRWLVEDPTLDNYQVGSINRKLEELEETYNRLNGEADT